MPYLIHPSSVAGCWTCWLLAPATTGGKAHHPRIGDCPNNGSLTQRESIPSRWAFSMIRSEHFQ